MVVNRSNLHVGQTVFFVHKEYNSLTKMKEGLNAKNAILIVEYAKMNMENGEPVVKAALDAARLRLRPILMTSFAFILGCVPLAIATGPGAGARVSMGNAVVGGMTFATMIGIFMIPVLFVVVERIFNRKKHSEE